MSELAGGTYKREQVSVRVRECESECESECVSECVSESVRASARECGMHEQNSEAMEKLICWWYDTPPQ